ncbi:hypothetical protein HDU91_000470 [Kappamyces sp. JEL0680]|nr:hypothetical protein HDU91_000470 [Kappamyces sp. JEL0680]
MESLRNNRCTGVDLGRALTMSRTKPVENMKFTAPLLSSVVLSAAIKSAAPPAGQVSINNIVHGGSGCPQGSAAVVLSDDRQTFTVIYDKFIAFSGTGSTVKDTRKNCQLNVGLSYPQGWSYTVITVDYRGYAQLPAQVTAVQKAIYYFSGDQEQTASQRVIPENYVGDYVFRDTLLSSAVVWSPCGANANINIDASVRLVGTAAALAQGAQVTVDSTDGKFKQVFGIQWQQC